MSLISRNRFQNRMRIIVGFECCVCGGGCVCGLCCGGGGGGGFFKCLAVRAVLDSWLLIS